MVSQECGADAAALAARTGRHHRDASDRRTLRLSNGTAEADAARVPTATEGDRRRVSRAAGDPRGAGTLGSGAERGRLSDGNASPAGRARAGNDSPTRARGILSH